MHARMTHSLTVRHGRHVRRMSSQAPAGQCSTWKVGNYGWTSRGPPESMVLHAAVQWFALFRCVWRPRAIARSTLTARVIARAASGWFCRYVTSPKPHRLSMGRHGRSPASEMDRLSTVAGVVASVSSAAGFVRIPRSRPKVSFCSLSASATACRFSLHQVFRH